MPIIQSAIKRVRQEGRRRQRNLIVTKKYKSLLKEFEVLIKEKKIAEATKLFPSLQKALDMAVKKNLVHANTGARKKSRLSKLLVK